MCINNVFRTQNPFCFIKFLLKRDKNPMPNWGKFKIKWDKRCISKQIDYLILKLTFTYALPVYFKLKIHFVLSDFYQQRKNNFMQNWRKVKIEWVKSHFSQNWLDQTAYQQQSELSVNHHLLRRLFMWTHLGQPCAQGAREATFFPARHLERQRDAWGSEYIKKMVLKYAKKKSVNVEKIKISSKL